MTKKSFGIVLGLMVLCLEHAWAQDNKDIEATAQNRKVVLPKVQVRIDVVLDKKEKVLDPLPIMDYKEIKGRQIEGCEILQGVLYENTTLTKYIRGVYPVSMDKRWYRWLRYTDAEFLIFREDKNSPIMCARFSRAGMTIDFWNINPSTIRGVDAKGIVLLRDTAEGNGPSPTRPSATYLYVWPKTLIYQEINFLGKTVRMKEYTADYELGLLDAVVYNKKMYMININTMVVFTIDQDKMLQENQTTIPPNLLVQVGYTMGRVFLFVLNDANGMRLAASNGFNLDNVYTHLRGKYINLVKSGNRQFVIWVQEDMLTGTGKYYYIVNTNANKSSSLVFEPIPSINMQYTQIFEMNDRIHFVKDSQHVMFTKGSKKSLINFVNTQPILGLLYWSYYQYMSEDQFLTVADVESQGILKIASISFTPPKVVCPPRPSTYEKYEKFSVFNKKNEYQFEVVFHTTGVSDFVSGTIFQHAVCVLAGVAVVMLSYVLLRKTYNDKDAEALNNALSAKREAQDAQLPEEERRKSFLVDLGEEFDDEDDDEVLDDEEHQH